MLNRYPQGYTKNKKRKEHKLKEKKMKKNTLIINANGKTTTQTLNAHALDTLFNSYHSEQMNNPDKMGYSIERVGELVLHSIRLFAINVTYTFVKAF